MHQTKPKTSLVQHVEYEPDLLTHAREKRGVKIGTNFWTPCSYNSTLAYGKLDIAVAEKRRGVSHPTTQFSCHIE